MEVLLVTGTSFLSRDLCENGEPRRDNQASCHEQLEEACWNGLLPTMLPEIFSAPGVSDRLYIWEIKAAAAFLQLDLGEAPVSVERRFSLIPQSFLSTRYYN
jgi:hypothetical protein